MAFGIIPKHTQEIPIDPLTQEEFLVLAVEAAQNCYWQITFLSGAGFKASMQATVTSSGEELILHVHQQIASLSSESKGKQLFNNGKNKKNVEHFLAVFHELKNNHDKTDLPRRYEALRQHFSAKDGNTIPPSEQKRSAIPDILKMFIPVEGYFVTPILIDLNVLIWILMCLSGANPLWPQGEIILEWGANYKPRTLNGEWWRIITANFLHFGIIHLFFNMNALLYIGITLEPMLGRLKFLLAYLLTGITCCLASLWWHDEALAAGASGCIFGMYGVFFALLTTNLIEKEHRMGMLKSIGFFVVFNLVFGATLGADNAGHIGGLLGGLFLGYCFYLVFLKPKLKVILLSLSTALILALAVFAYKTIPNPEGVEHVKIK